MALSKLNVRKQVAREALSSRGQRECTGCGEIKAKTEFNTKRDGPEGLASECNECSRRRAKEYYHKNPARSRKQCRRWIEKQGPEAMKQRYHKDYEKRRHRMRTNKLERLYQIGMVDYNEAFILQNGCCAICATHQSALNQALGVDHDHKTGEVRGLLCSRCNMALGGFKDNHQLLQKAIDYLNKEPTNGID